MAFPAKKTNSTDDSTRRFAPFQLRFSRTIAITVGTGLLLAGTLFAAISILSLLGFYNFQQVLVNLSNEKFPNTTKEAQVSILFNQLQQQTNYLYNSSTQSQRRIAFNVLNHHFQKIAGFSKTLKTESTRHHYPKTDHLEKSIKKLNELVADRIEGNTRTDGLVADLFLLANDISSNT